MTAALIIATGRTMRKSRFEPQKEVGTIPAIQRIARIFQRAGLERIVVVCSDDGDKTEKLVPHMNLVFLHSPKDAEMIDSVKVGLTYLQDKCEAVLISHVDVPLFSIETVHTLMNTEGAVCIPTCRGRGGHPMLLRAEQFQTVLSYTGDGGLAGAVSASGLQQLVEVGDEGILTDIQNDDSYTHLVAEHDLLELHPEFTFRLMKEQVFYGPGAHQLLQLTGETGSLLEACRRMGISYTKGRKMVSDIEQQMGCPVVESQQGGKAGGSTFVTKEGKQLIASYNAFCAEAKQYLGQLFQKHFPQ